MASKASKPVDVKTETKSSSHKASGKGYHDHKRSPVLLSDDPNLCSTCLIFGYSRPADCKCPSCEANPMCSRCKHINVCISCRESQEGYDASKDPRYASETTARAVCCIHLKSRGLTNFIPNDDGTYRCKDTQPCLKKDHPKARAKARIKEKKKSKERKKQKSSHHRVTRRFVLAPAFCPSPCRR